MPYGQPKEVACLKCGEVFPHAKKLSTHIKNEYGLSSYDYVVKYQHNGVTPTCPNCSGPVRFVSLGAGFKKFCRDCATKLASAHGKVGGKKKTQWNKGKTKHDSAIIARVTKQQTGEGNPFFGHKHTPEAKAAIADKKRLPFIEVKADIEARLELTLLSSPEEYDTQNSLLRVRCFADHEFERSYFDLQRSEGRCHTCDPIGYTQEFQIKTFVESLGFETKLHDRKVLNGREIDVWVPSAQLGIEYHGFHWHSESDMQHLPQLKYELAVRAGARLLQFFEDEWRDKREICESIIRHALKKSVSAAYARECDVRVINRYDAESFFNQNHIDGHTQASVYFGLFATEKLVMALSLRVPKRARERYADAFEVARMAALCGTHVPGGASKLMASAKEWVLAHDKSQLLSYVDLRIGDGSVYANCGIKRTGDTAKPRQWFVNDATKQRVSRESVRADNDRGMSQKQVAEERGLRELHGTKNAVFCGNVSKLNGHAVQITQTLIAATHMNTPTKTQVKQPKPKRLSKRALRHQAYGTVKCPICQEEVSAVKRALGVHMGIKHPDAAAAKRAKKRSAVVKGFKIVCLECGDPVANSNNVLGHHLRQRHGGMEYVDYYVKHALDGVYPLCHCGCGNRAPWDRHAFKAFINGHRSSIKRISMMTVKCLECKTLVSETEAGLMKHIGRKHKQLGVMGYVIKHSYAGRRPTCGCGCGAEVEWHKGEFRTFRRGHSGRIAKK